MSKQQKRLRFGAFVRVSTERQAKQGESLKTQTTDLTEDVLRLGGEIQLYGGQEHATPGFEKVELDRLLRDAHTRQIDAVIVHHPDRWSRDNAQSKKGLEILKDAGVRFFVRSQEFDLHSPLPRFYLGMSAEIGELQASTQSQKSMENRLHRAKQGKPVCGKLPFGRLYDRSTGKWSIVESKRDMMLDVAKRYLAGESIGRLALEYGVNHTSLHKSLRHRCGDTWVQTFHSRSHGIDEKVTISIPRLLPEKTIQKVIERMDFNKTYGHCETYTKYLLSGLIFCDRCGIRLSGQLNPSGKRYYRHTRQLKASPCHGPCGWVPADEIEENVFQRIFELLNDDSALAIAMQDAIPDKPKQKSLEREKALAAKRLAEAETAVQRLVKAIAAGTIDLSDAAPERTRLAESIAANKQTIARAESQLHTVPNAEQQRLAVRRFDRFRRLSQNREAWTFEMRRQLITETLQGVAPNGSPLGVRINWDGLEGVKAGRGTPYAFRILGTVGELELSQPLSLEGRAARDAFDPGRDLCPVDYAVDQCASR